MGKRKEISALERVDIPFSKPKLLDRYRNQIRLKFPALFFHIQNSFRNWMHQYQVPEVQVLFPTSLHNVEQSQDTEKIFL